MTFLFRRALILAAVEGAFRTDQVPSPTVISHTGINSTSDVDDTTEVITIASHGWLTGDGPVQATVETGALPAPDITAATDYWIIKVDANSVKIATSLANAVAGTAVDLTDAVGTFTLADVQSDAFLVEEPEFAPEITVLERNNARTTLSIEPSIVARKIATVTFMHEIRSNGNTDATLRPRIGVLLRGCGMAETKFGESGNTEETILDSAPIPINSPTGTFTYAKTTGYAGTLPRVVILQCTTLGGSGTAEFTVYSPAVGDQAEVNTTGVVMTSSGAFALAESAVITPTVGTSFAEGDTYVINLAPAGHYYTPVSENFDSLSMYLYFGDTSGALKHRLTGARGTFEATGEASDYGRFNFTFTGDYNIPTDDTMPANPTYETTLPPQIEVANLVALGGKDFSATSPTETQLCAQSFNIDLANNVVARACINAAESLGGGLITGRMPVGSFNPETTLEASHPFWALMSDGTRVFWNVRVGKTQGNVVTFTAPHAQYTELAYGNRDDIRVYDVTTKLVTEGSDNELRIVFS